MRSRGDVSEDARLDLTLPPTLPILTSVAVTKGREKIKPRIVGLFGHRGYKPERAFPSVDASQPSKAHLLFSGLTDRTRVGRRERFHF